MKTLTVRNVPDDLYRSITRIAKRNRRSIQQQVLILLDHSRILDSESPLERARAVRRHLSGRQLGDTLADIHEERRR
jgi:plasmid stability protein